MALNRVTGGLGPSEILGSLTANGRIFQINRDGILFGPGAAVNSAGASPPPPPTTSSRIPTHGRPLGPDREALSPGSTLAGYVTAELLIWKKRRISGLGAIKSAGFDGPSDCSAS